MTHTPTLVAVFWVVLTAFLTQSDPRSDRGSALFDHRFTTHEGVGAPEFNADSCRACHRDPAMGGAGPLELNVSRFGNDQGGAGPFTNLPGGQAVSKLCTPGGLREEIPAEADVFEQRQTPSLFGGGLIDSIPASVIIANEDPTDADRDGIFGVARRVQVNGVTEIGRFGWKAQIPHLRDFIHDAMFGELGLTTPDEGRHFGARSDGDQLPDPEVTSAQIDDIEFFMADLPAPQRGGSTDPRVLLGTKLFFSVGCAKCHTPALLGTRGPVPLFSDLLLHNVMPAAFRGMSENGAGKGLYRTPPLWGIKHTAPYLHDGRAEDLTSAILGHDGEAATVRADFLALLPDDQQALILFLEDL